MSSIASLNSTNPLLAAIGERAARRERGKLSKIIGDRFEQWLTGHHLDAVHRGIARWIRKVGAPAEYKRSGGQLKLVFTGVGPADYIGELSDGRTIVIEAKSHDERTGPFRRNEIPTHQQDHLTEAGLSLLVVEFRGRLRNRVFAIPWRQVPWRKLRTAESIDPSILGEYEVEMCGRTYLHRALTFWKTSPASPST